MNSVTGRSRARLNGGKHRVGFGAMKQDTNENCVGNDDKYPGYDKRGRGQSVVETKNADAAQYAEAVLMKIAICATGTPAASSK